MTKIKIIAKTLSLLLIGFTFSILNVQAFAVKNESAETSKPEDKLELETLKMQANKELPKGLYIVPWREIREKKGKKSKHKLVLHSMYGDLFEPVDPYEYLND